MQNTGTVIDQSPKKTSKIKILGIATLGLVGLCTLCVAIAAIQGNTPSAKATFTARALMAQANPTQKQQAEVTIQNTIAPSATKLIPTNTPVPTNTPRPTLGMDMSQFISKYDSFTDLQKKDFISQSVGKWVSWTGTIVDVQSDGSIVVDIPGTLASSIDLKGVPNNVAITLSKDQPISYEGRLSNIIDFLGLHIYLEDVRIIN
jgi:hypothetical protein